MKNNDLLKFVKKVCNGLGFDITRKVPKEPDALFPPDFDMDSKETISAVNPYTMTSPERIYSLCQAVIYVIKNNIPGDIVECGVWKGGSMMAVARTSILMKDLSRSLYLFDTYDGMPPSGDEDVDITGEAARDFLKKEQKDNPEFKWAYAALDQVKKAVLGTGYNPEKVNFIKGKVEDTIPEKAPEKISLLRLDTDWYESTRHEMNHLFPRLSKHGVIIIDDYGHWQGARQAVDEYLEENKIKLLLNRIDYTGRIGVKL